jgi:hypothetical protein
MLYSSPLIFTSVCICAMTTCLAGFLEHRQVHIGRNGVSRIRIPARVPARIPARIAAQTEP